MQLNFYRYTDRVSPSRSFIQFLCELKYKCFMSKEVKVVLKLAIRYSNRLALCNFYI